MNSCNRILHFISLFLFLAVAPLAAQESAHPEKSKVAANAGSQKDILLPLQGYDEIIEKIRSKFIRELNENTLPEEPINLKHVESVSGHIVQTINYVMAYIDHEEQLRNRLKYLVVYDRYSSPFSFGLKSFDQWLNSQGCIEQAQLSGFENANQHIPTLKLTDPPLMPLQVDFLIDDGTIYSEYMEVFLSKGATLFRGPEPYILPD